MKRPVWSRVLIGVVALAFGYAALVKLNDPERFLSSLLTFELFPYKLAVALALWVPWLELVLAVSLLSGRWRSGAEALTGLLLVAFIAVVVQAYFRGLSIDCGCYGSNLLSDGMDYAVKLGENLLLLSALWLGGRWRPSS